MSMLDDLRASIEATKPVQYYAINDALPQGKTFRITSDGYYPDLWIFNPGDFAAKRAELAQHCRLVDFRSWEPSSDQVDRLWQRTIDAAIDEDMRQWIEALRVAIRPA